MTWLATALLPILMAASPAGAASDPCGLEGSLVGLANGHGILALCAASDVVAGADSVCNAVLGADWRTNFPAHLASRTPRASVAAGLDWLCATIQALPVDRRNATVHTLESWLEARSTVDGMVSIVGVEAFATAVAFVPAVADLLPRDENARAAMGRDVGGSLASAEAAWLEYNLARRLSHMSGDGRIQCLRDLWGEALKSEE